MTKQSDNQDYATLSQSVRYVVRALRLVWQSGRMWSVVNAVLIVVRGALPLMMLWIVRLMVDTAVEQVSSGCPDFVGMAQVLALLGVMFVVNSVTASLHTIVKQRQSFLLSRHVSTLIHDKTTSVSFLFFEDTKYQNVFFRAVSDSLSKPQAVFYNIVAVLQNSLTLCAIAVVLVSVHWLMPIVVVVIGLPVVLLRIRFSRRYYNLLRRQTDDERRVQYYNRVLTAKEFAKEVRLFGLARVFRRRYLSKSLKLHRRRERIMLRNAVAEALVQLLMSAAMLCVFGFVIYLATVGDMSVGMLAMYFMALHRAYGMAQGLLSSIAALYEANLFLKNLFEFIDMPAVTVSATATFPRPMQRGITVNDVSFKYPGTERTVLEGITMHVDRGETVALVGTNGCGKSTLIKLLCGLYEPTQGAIEIDGVSINSIHPSDISRNVSAVFQDFMLYNATARDNIRFGNVEAVAEAEAVAKAARRAGIDELFERLPKGYSTPLGYMFPGAEMLSQGEWQRVALARSFFNEEAQIIILDEPTSSLDAFTEADLLQNFRDITGGRTAVIVSHRLSTIRLADRVIVLKNKHIEEQGSYDDLLHRGGYFAEMVERFRQ